MAHRDQVALALRLATCRDPEPVEIDRGLSLIDSLKTDLGDDGEKVCPYCSTLYRFKAELAATDTLPPGHLWQEAA